VRDPILTTGPFPDRGWLYVAKSPSLNAEAHCAIVVGGRFCSEVTPGLSCCLPCPQTEWLYPNNFDTISSAANWVNVAGMVCTVFLLTSFAFLPVKQTHRHYLTICLSLAVGVMQVSSVPQPIVGSR
jgi:hypothetical protein